MRKERSVVDLKYADFLKRRKRGMDNVVAGLIFDYHDVYGSGEPDESWDAMQAEYQARYEAENVDS